MSHHLVHMRDQKHNQLNLRSKQYRQAAINTLEEIILIIVLWSVFLLTGSN